MTLVCERCHKAIHITETSCYEEYFFAERNAVDVCGFDDLRNENIGTLLKCPHCNKLTMKNEIEETFEMIMKKCEEFIKQKGTGNET